MGLCCVIDEGASALRCGGWVCEGCRRWSCFQVSRGLLWWLERGRAPFLEGEKATFKLIEWRRSNRRKQENLRFALVTKIPLWKFQLVYWGLASLVCLVSMDEVTVRTAKPRLRISLRPKNGNRVDRSPVKRYRTGIGCSLGRCANR